MKDVVGALVRVARQIERERETAKPIVERLVAAIADRWDHDVPPQWQTAGFVDELNDAAHALLETSPATAQLVAQYAIVVVTSIPEDAYPQPIVAAKEAAAWKELASAHGFCSEYDAAVRALDAGDLRIASYPALDYDRAVLRYARAALYADMQRLEEAADLAGRCAVTFAQYQDHRRSGQCLGLKGAIEQRRGFLAEACATYERAIAVLKQTDDLHSRACLYNNLGRARTDLGELAAAVAALNDALALFRELRSTVEIAKVTWNLGRVLLQSGKAENARVVLAAARASFQALGMREEVGLTGLELAEAYIALNQRMEALAVVERTLSEFREAGLTERALTALAYVRDLIPTPHASAALRHVRAFLEGVRRDPLRAFVPLPPSDE